MSLSVTGETLRKTLRSMRAPSIHKFRVIRRRVAIGRRSSYVMNGGPVAKAYLHSAGTLPFRIGEFFGYYDKENKWVEL